VVLVAVLDKEIVGEAMLVVDRADPRSAEVAFSVVDRLQRRGLGRALLDLVLDEARRRGVTLIRADLLGENVASVALLRQTEFTLRFENRVLVGQLALGTVGRGG
jgi:GNAT superfamily N-acetyltransferase